MIVDEDAALLDLLTRLLEEAGYSVDTVCGAEGFTPQLMALSRPSVVFLNPFLAGLAAPLISSVVMHFRKVSPASVILIGPTTAEVLAKRTEELQADGYVRTRDLLDDPVGEVPVPGSTPAALELVEERVPAAPTLDDLDAGAILELDLVHGTPEQPVRVQPVAAAAKPAPTATLSRNLLTLIEDEVHAPQEPQEPLQLSAELDVFTDNNFYGPDRTTVEGVFIASPLPPMVGRPAALSLRIPPGKTYEVRGTVEWVADQAGFGRRQRGGFGVRFADLSPETRNAFARFVTLRAVRVVGPNGP
jgi:hypothetical protein